MRFDYEAYEKLYPRKQKTLEPDDTVAGKIIEDDLEGAEDDLEGAEDGHEGNS